MSLACMVGAHRWAYAYEVWSNYVKMEFATVGYKHTFKVCGRCHKVKPCEEVDIPKGIPILLQNL